MLFFGTATSVAVITAPFPPTDAAGDQARNTATGTVPLVLHERRDTETPHCLVWPCVDRVVGSAQIASATAKPFSRSMTRKAWGAEKCAGNNTALRSTHCSSS